MYIQNRRNSSKINGFGSHQTLCLTESFVLRNPLLRQARNRYPNAMLAMQQTNIKS